jgi:hypothetical protein
MLKTIGKLENPFIVNFNPFVVALFNDSKSHVNQFIVLNNAIGLTKCNSDETAYNFHLAPKLHLLR